MTTTFILDNKVDCFEDFNSFFEFLRNDLKGNECRYITVNNVHTFMEAHKNQDYQRIINQSYLSIPDGMPLVLLSRRRTKLPVCRLFGPSVMEYFIDKGRDFNYSHFFFGSSEATLQKIKKAIDKKFPGTKIAGMISPPFKPFEEWDNDDYISLINNSNPDFIWIGLGAPRQEYWMAQHYKELKSSVMFGIGAGFDYVAGNSKHAPRWMKKSSLEWLYRLTQEPRRLWKRYLITIPQFLFFASFELLGIKFKRSRNGSK